MKLVHSYYYTIITDISQYNVDHKTIFKDVQPLVAKIPLFFYAQGIENSCYKSSTFKVFKHPYIPRYLHPTEKIKE